MNAKQLMVALIALSVAGSAFASKLNVYNYTKRAIMVKVKRDMGILPKALEDCFKLVLPGGNVDYVSTGFYTVEWMDSDGGVYSVTGNRHGKNMIQGAVEVAGGHFAILKGGDYSYNMGVSVAEGTGVNKFGPVKKIQ